MRKDKKQIIGEEISDESIVRRRAGRRHAPSLHKLIKAYRGLRIDDFERFLTFFREAGYDLDARDARATTSSPWSPTSARPRPTSKRCRRPRAPEPAMQESPPFGGFFVARSAESRPSENASIRMAAGGGKGR